MVFNTGAALLDAIVLATVSKEDNGTYGYKITQDVRSVLDISESTLYPILKRLESGGLLTVYSVEHNGRLQQTLLPNFCHGFKQTGRIHFSLE